MSEEIELINDKVKTLPAPKPKPFRILLVEDNVGDRMLVKYALEEVKLDTPVEMKEALTAEEAIDLLHREDFDVILLDLNLPGIGGHNGLLYVKSDGPMRWTPIIVPSTSEFQDDVKKAYEQRAACYIKKPDFGDLVIMLRDLITFWTRWVVKVERPEL